jgi:hypothetical protein
MLTANLTPAQSSTTVRHFSAEGAGKRFLLQGSDEVSGRQHQRCSAQGLSFLFYNHKINTGCCQIAQIEVDRFSGRL